MDNDLPETLTLVLKRPLQLGDGPAVAELHLEEPTAGQIETALKEPSAVSANIVLVSLVAKLAPAQVRAMLTSDFNKAVDFLSGFTRETAPAPGA